MIIKIFAVIGVISLMLMGTFIYSALLARLDESDKLDEDQEQEEYLEKWKEKRNGRGKDRERRY